MFSENLVRFHPALSIGLAFVSDYLHGPDGFFANVHDDHDEYDATRMTS